MARLLIAAAAIFVAVVLFVVLRPGEDGEPAMGTTTSTTPTTTVPPPPPMPPSPPSPARVRITIRDGLPVGGIRRLTVTRGRTVVLIVTSDVSDHIHLHGYDVSREVGPGMPVQLRFRATIAGTVEAELENSHVQIATITAQ